MITVNDLEMCAIFDQSSFNLVCVLYTPSFVTMFVLACVNMFLTENIYLRFT